MGFAVDDIETHAEEISDKVDISIDVGHNYSNRSSFDVGVEENYRVVDTSSSNEVNLDVLLEGINGISAELDGENVFSIYDSVNGYNSSLSLMLTYIDDNTGEVKQAQVHEPFIENPKISYTIDTSDVNGDLTIATARSVNSFSYYFQSSKWISRSGVISLSLSPKQSWVRTVVHGDNPNASASLKNDSWQTVLNNYSGHSNWRNTSSMRSQYMCHVHWAGYWKTPWNLEPHRTGTAIASNSCNP